MTLTIELAGDLAGILALTANGKKPATMSRDGLASNVRCGEAQPALFAGSANQNTSHCRGLLMRSSALRRQSRILVSAGLEVIAFAASSA